jgi:hypothetical protein
MTVAHHVAPFALHHDYDIWGDDENKEEDEDEEEDKEDVNEDEDVDDDVDDISLTT